VGHAETSGSGRWHPIANASNGQRAIGNRRKPNNEENRMETNDNIIRRFLNAVRNLDADELIEYFVGDATYHNIPLPILNGRNAIYEFLKGWPKRFRTIEVEILNQIGLGDIVMNERIDTITFADRKAILPVAGVFIMSKGKIREWREYFDLNTFKGAP
jgi:limonene-1,2-epoxide hydrolase